MTRIEAGSRVDCGWSRWIRLARRSQANTCALGTPSSQLLPSASDVLRATSVSIELYTISALGSPWRTHDGNCSDSDAWLTGSSTLHR
ncbi:hypothetical protein D3C76_1685290 [compost metagenome]